MKIILLSGGSGRRLWPLSNETRSKQFIRILGNGSKNRESMIQRIWHQLQISGLSNSTFISTGIAQADILQNQIGSDIRLIIEPVRRDSFPAIALAATTLYSKYGVDLDEIVSIIPVDLYTEACFFQKVKKLESVLRNTDADLGLIGIKPKYPSEKYGYIVPESYNNEGLFSVCNFIEKPKIDKARELISKNALWNSGVFAFKLRFIISLLKERGLPTNNDELVSIYSTLPSRSFDFEVVERTKGMVSLTYEGKWEDLGTWGSLTDNMPSTLIGKGLISQDTEDTHLINELDIPIAINGVNGLVVIASPDGILVTDKKKSENIKFLADIHSHRPMFEERRWGWYKVLDYTSMDNGHKVLTKRLLIKKNKSISYQVHSKRSEVWTVIKGTGELALNGELKIINVGDVIQIPINIEHGLFAITEMEIIEVQRGQELVEEDIYRIYMKWDDVVNAFSKKKKN